MPRKFLGEKIDRNIDFQRPSSLTLTCEDLKCLPDFNLSNEDLVLAPSKNGKRLSRRFGGTMTLKQRLESVPELFLHDFKKRSNVKEKRVPPPVRNGLKTYNGLPRRKPPMRYATEIPALINKPLNNSESNDQVYIENAPMKKRAVTELGSELQRGGDFTSKIENVYLEPIVMPVQVETHYNQYLGIPKEELQKYGKSDSEILFDEIISAYDSKHMKGNNVLNSEIVSMLGHVKGNNKNDNSKANDSLMVPKIISAEAEEEKKRLSINSIGTPLLQPETPSKLINIMDSPQYSNGASISSSGDEFSDIASSIQNSLTYSREDDYLTALDSIPSLASVDDLEIAEQKTDLSPISTNLVPTEIENTVEKAHVKTVTLKPRLFMCWDSDDEEDPIGELNRRIENIDIKSIYSDSSSVYSDH
ncbi:Protein DSE3 [Nakaseomyces bracarensis]|uniref:Protein DSE3 n=1 Tax=Nakaseomyces bracarensis TaxID=273131 RepID=A0ABR4NSJ9_9SACH